MLVQKMSIPSHGDSDSLGIFTSTRLPDAALQDPATYLADFVLYPQIKATEVTKELNISVGILIFYSAINSSQCGLIMPVSIASHGRGIIHEPVKHMFIGIIYTIVVYAFIRLQLICSDWPFSFYQKPSTYT